AGRVRGAVGARARHAARPRAGGGRRPGRGRPLVPGLGRRRIVHRREDPPPRLNGRAERAASHTLGAMPVSVPRDPLARFPDTAWGLAGERRGWENRSILRSAALPLVLAPGEPAQVAARAAASGRALAEQSGWLSGLRGAMRWVIAALLAGRDAARSGDEIAAVRERFHRAGVRRGGAYEMVAAAMLHLA